MSNLDNPSTYAVTMSALNGGEWFHDWVYMNYTGTIVRTGIAYQMDRKSVSPTVDKWPQSSWFADETQDTMRLRNFVFAGLDYGPDWRYDQCSQQTKVWRAYHIMQINGWANLHTMVGWDAWIFAPAHVMGDVRFINDSYYQHTLTMRNLQQNWFVSIRPSTEFAVTPGDYFPEVHAQNGLITVSGSPARRATWHNHLLSSGDSFIHDLVGDELDDHLFHDFHENFTRSDWFPVVRQLMASDVALDQKWLLAHKEEEANLPAYPNDAPVPIPPNSIVMGISYEPIAVNPLWWTYEYESHSQHPKNFWSWEGVKTVDIDSQQYIGHFEYVPGWREIALGKTRCDLKDTNSKKT